MKSTIFNNFLVATLVLGCSSLSLKGQTLAKNTNTTRSDTVSKKIIDYATLRIFYDLTYIADTTDIQYKRHAQTVLQIGKHCSKFSDYYRLLSDSINDEGSRSKSIDAGLMAKLMSASQKTNYKPCIIKGFPNDGNTIQSSVVLVEIYNYNDIFPEIDWIMINKTDTILNYPCKAAICNFRGREYTAWYTEEIPISNGPFLFKGLPGLILKIEDTKQHYVFVANGIVQRTIADPIYIYTGNNLINSTRERFRKAQKNFFDNPAQGLMNTGKTITISPEDLANIKPIPYNPIELE